MPRNPIRMLKSGLKMMALGAAGFCGLNIVAGNAKFHEKYAMPIIHRMLDPEQAHRLGVYQAKFKLLPMWGENYAEYMELKVRLWGREFSNCVGLAAGFDKNAEAIDGLDASGFGFIEIGSVTPEAQPGNPKPRVSITLEQRSRHWNRSLFSKNNSDLLKIHLGIELEFDFCSLQFEILSISLSSSELAITWHLSILYLENGGTL